MLSPDHGYGTDRRRRLPGYSQHARLSTEAAICGRYCDYTGRISGRTGISNAVDRHRNCCTPLLNAYLAPDAVTAENRLTQIDAMKLVVTVPEHLRFPPYRNDMGALWENFVVVERLKTLNYTYGSGSLYFWRTHTGAEVDLVEERDGQLYGYECKWGKARPRSPRSFLDAYPGAQFAVVSPDNFTEFLAVNPD